MLGVSSGLWFFLFSTRIDCNNAGAAEDPNKNNLLMMVLIVLVQLSFLVSKFLSTAVDLARRCSRKSCIMKEKRHISYPRFIILFAYTSNRQSGNATVEQGESERDYSSFTIYVQGILQTWRSLLRYP